MKRGNPQTKPYHHDWLDALHLDYITSLALIPDMDSTSNIKGIIENSKL